MPLKWPCWNWWSEAETLGRGAFVEWSVRAPEAGRPRLCASAECDVNMSSVAPRRFWAKVEYDGTDFFGFQIQASERTVQGELERALEVVAGVKTRVVGAGRTDRGVHARGQVISFEVMWRHSLSDLQRALNAVLSADVVVLELGLAPEGFHPRFSARRRAYRYTILNRRWPSALERRTAWHVTQELDVPRMADAGHCLVGTHDFATFGQAPAHGAEGENTVRTVFRADWLASGSQLLFDIEANAFLYRMVRSIVGTLVLVGWGQVSSREYKEMLLSRDRSLVKQVAPAHGLCLMRVDYAAHGGVGQ
jgi:tRNA pseudouridine38-40 synthase